MDKKTSTKSASTTLKSTSKAASKTGSKKPIPSEAQIALRAYYISQRRQQFGWDGDPISDWVEAERQLREEK